MTKIGKKELTFQLLLHIVLFIFFSFDKHSPHIQLYQVVFFVNYVLAAACINYVLLPKFYYSKKYVGFILGVMLVIGMVILTEELFLEQIFFPDTRGKSFPGIVFSLLEVAPIILLLTGFKFAWDAYQKQVEVLELKQVVKESELRFLKSQINPHFLFNNLNNLYSYAIENSPKTPHIILELSSVLRYMLYDCKENFVPVDKEMEHLQNFTQLSELQIEGRGSVLFTKELPSTKYQITPLILSVFVENAFKHSTASQNDEIFIAIKVRITDNGILKFECKNSFAPIGNVQGLSSGIGLSNVKKRLNIIYPDAHKLGIQSSEKYFEVNLELKLKELYT